MTDLNKLGDKYLPVALLWSLSKYVNDEQTEKNFINKFQAV